jgi:hypothetical protein
MTYTLPLNKMHVLTAHAICVSCTRLYQHITLHKDQIRLDAEIRGSLSSFVSVNSALLTRDFSSVVGLRDDCEGVDSSKETGARL